MYKEKIFFMYKKKIFFLYKKKIFSSCTRRRSYIEFCDGVALAKSPLGQDDKIDTAIWSEATFYLARIDRRSSIQDTFFARMPG